ncbi:MAG: transposase [bacterium]|nr:transposase [bacterium]
MQKRGKTNLGKQRWFCTFCNQSAIRKRIDLRNLYLEKQFIRWLTGNSSLEEIASKRKESKRTLIRKFNTYWRNLSQPTIKTLPDNYILISDGVYIHKRECCVLIARSKTSVISWKFVDYESSITWCSFFKTLKQPKAITCDGQKGMILAIKTLWPTTRIQRCFAHFIRSEQIYLTKRPKTQSGKELLDLIKKLPCVWTRRQKRKWIHSYWKLFKKYSVFLKERSYFTNVNGATHWWYTHRHLRSAYYFIKHCLPYMFTYIGHYDVPRTSNHVEGGINARLKELIHRHRGLSIERKKVLVSYFLTSKQY